MSIAAGRDDLTTAHIADGARRAGIRVRYGPSALRPISPRWRAFGPAFTVVHSGSVDDILEAITHAEPGSLLIIDDDGRPDRGCLGDQVALEASSERLAGVIVNGCHRDTAQLLDICLPVFSIGAHPSGPTTTTPRPADPFKKCSVGTATVHRGDLVVADADGVVIVDQASAPAVLTAAAQVRDTEMRQLEAARSGRSLRDQFEFDRYLQRRSAGQTTDFYTHLQQLGAAIE